MKTIKRIFVLLAAPLTGKRLIAVLSFPADLDDFITFARAIHDSMLASPFFASLAAKLNALNNNITTLEQMHTGTQTKPPTTTVAQRDAALLIVQNDLRTLKADVQTLADATPASAETIITAADMKVKKQGAINKQDFIVKNGVISGSALLIAKGITKTHSAHDWAKSADGINWTPLTPTLAATTVESGLVRASIVKFRHRNILKDGPGDWSQTEELVIK
jgi:hypothetical protein